MSRIKKNNNKRLNVLISAELRKKYRKMCLDKDIMVSDRIREIMEKDLNGEIK